MGLFDDTYTPFDPNDWGDWGGDESVSPSDDWTYGEDDSSWFDDLFTPDWTDEDLFSGILGDEYVSPGDAWTYGDQSNWIDDLWEPSQDYSDYSWMDDFIQEGDPYSADDIIGMTDEELAAAIAELEGSGGQETAGGGGPFGWGILPGIRNVIFGSGEGPLGGNVLEGGGILGSILGLGGGGGAAGGGYQRDANGDLIFDANGNPIPIGGGGGLGSLLGGDGGFGGPLMTFLAMKSLLKDQPEGTVPVGGEAYGGPAFNYQDYQPTNLKPALMPGVGYANVGVPQPPGMRAGGRSDGPGDITFAKLEPGEFVIQKPVVDAVGIERLEQLNNMFG